MFPRARTRLTYANVMSTVAVFVALGGGAYAAIKVTGRNIVDGTVTGRDIKNGSIQRVDLVKSLASRFGATGATGAPGPAGAVGPAGANGTTGATGQDLSPPGVAYAEALGEVSTSSSTTADLGGPSVSVTVGPGGLVEVYAFSRGKPDSFGPSALVALGTSAPLAETIMSFTTDTQFTARTTMPGTSTGNGSTTPGGWLVLRLRADDLDVLPDAQRGNGHVRHPAALGAAGRLGRRPPRHRGVRGRAGRILRVAAYRKYGPHRRRTRATRRRGAQRDPRATAGIRARRTHPHQRAGLRGRPA